jgi:hypothetical protein
MRTQELIVPSHAPTRVGMPAQAAGAPPQPPRYTMMDVKTLSGANEHANELYHEGPHARQRRRGAPVAERARRVNGEYIHREGAHAGPRAQQAGGRQHALPRRA